MIKTLNFLTYPYFIWIVFHILDAVLQNICSLCLKCFLSVPDRTRPDLINEDLQKRFALEMQRMQTLEILRQLEDFRSGKDYHTSVIEDIMILWCMTWHAYILHKRFSLRNYYVHVSNTVMNIDSGQLKCNWLAGRIQCRIRPPYYVHVFADKSHRKRHCVLVIVFNLIIYLTHTTGHTCPLY